MPTRLEYRDELIAQHTGKAGLRGKINAKCIECIMTLSRKGRGVFRSKNALPWTVRYF